MSEEPQEEIKRMSIKEFRELGLLQEINRNLLHPMGLALEVTINEETGEETIQGLWDCRDDPEGLIYEEINMEKYRRVGQLFNAKTDARSKAFGWIVQPAKDPKSKIITPAEFNTYIG